MPRKLTALQSVIALALGLNLAACGRSHPPASPPAPRLNHRAPTSDEPRARGRTGQLPQNVGDARVDPEQKAQYVAQLWLSPLGKMLRHFLYEDDPDHPLTELAHQIIDRMHRDVRMTLTRTSAYNMMIEDLFASGELTPQAHDRLALLNMSLQVAQHSLQSSSSREYAKFVPIIVATALILASPWVSDHLAAVGTRMWNALKSPFARAPGAAASGGSFYKHLGPAGVLLQKFTKGYRFGTAYAITRDLVGYGGLFYLVLRTGSADAVPGSNRFVVYQLQRLVEFDEI